MELHMVILLLGTFATCVWHCSRQTAVEMSQKSQFPQTLSFKWCVCNCCGRTVTNSSSASAHQPQPVYYTTQMKYTICAITQSRLSCTFWTFWCKHIIIIMKSVKHPKDWTQDMDDFELNEFVPTDIVQSTDIQLT